MANLNKVQIIGRLGQDPETKTLDSGATVCNFSVAVNETWKDKQGEKQERTEWCRVQTWNKLAELCAKYLSKGREAYVEGKLRTRSWETQSGEKRYATEIVASEVQFLGSGDNRSQQSSQGGGGGPAYEPEQEDEIPFIGLTNPTHNPGRRAV